ncbi:hypothetical protein D3C84_1006180 [compost metagenome]
MLDVEHDDLLLLPIAIQAANALYEAHGVPGQVIVDHDVTLALEVDAFSTGLCRDQKAPSLLKALNGVTSLSMLHGAID